MTEASGGSLADALLAWAIDQQIKDYEPVGRSCPGCGQLPRIRTGDMAWCANDANCRVVIWYPAESLGWHRSHIQEVNLGCGDGDNAGG
jgi:hypothetical protein